VSLLGIDVGTTQCKAASFSEKGQCMALSYREYLTRHPKPGQAELDSEEVWQEVMHVIRDVAAQTRDDPITALSVSSLGETMVPLSRNREILGSSILCNMDSRGDTHAAALSRDMGQEAFYAINPNIIGPQYSLPKLLWIRENDPRLFEQADLWLFWADCVGFMLGAEPVATNSLANRSLLLDLHKNDWSDALLEWAKLPREKLGLIVNAGTVVGTVSANMARELGLPNDVRIVAGGHDQCCNALGSGCTQPGKAVCGIGTFECITPVYSMPDNPLALLDAGLNIEHHVLPDLFVSFIFNQGGALVKWFRSTFAANDVVPDGQDIYAILNAEIPEDPTSLLVLPHFDTPVSPRYIPDSAGAIIGLRSDTSRGDILKAIMECETLYFYDSIQTLRHMGMDITELIATGGGARSDAWLQIKADIFGIPFVRPRIPEAGLAGAAMLAGLGMKQFSNPVEAAALFVEQDRLFEPNTRHHQIYELKAEQYAQLFPSLHGILKQL